MSPDDLRRAQEAIDREGDSGTPREERKSQATRLIEIAVSGAELWRCDDEAWATVQVANHREHWPLRSRFFRDGYLARSFYQQEGRVPGGQAVTDAMNTLHGIALFDGQHNRVFTRIGGQNGAIYLDLANDAWEVVEISAAGWCIKTNPPVRFRRTSAMLPIPTPKHGGTIGDLRRFVNVREEDWPLVPAVIVSLLRDRGPYPILVLHGEHGSAKSSLARVLRSLVDPNGAPLRVEPKEPRDLMIAAKNSWMVVLDNLSHISPWLSDALCRLSTGGGFATRKLYSDGDEAIFDAQRPVILNGIEELATRGDLLDRSVILHLPTIPDDKRRPEDAFWHEYEEAKPRILGAFLDAVVLALGGIEKVSLARLPRMADFAIWATAAEAALGIAPGKFMVAYTGNRDDANAMVLESSPVAALVQMFVANDEWEGTATDLLNELTELADERTRQLKSWPKTPRSLSNVLRKLAPNLRAVGVEVTFNRRPSQRTISLARVGKTSSSSSFASSASSPPLGPNGTMPQASRNDDDGVTQANRAPRYEDDANDDDDARFPTFPKVGDMGYEEVF